MKIIALAKPLATLYKLVDTKKQKSMKIIALAKPLARLYKLRYTKRTRATTFVIALVLIVKLLSKVYSDNSLC